jgi:hypothetical protein
MGRRNKTKYYCPKCSKKTLVRAFNAKTTWKPGWECTNQPPQMWAKLIAALNSGDPDELDDPYVYSSYKARWGDDPEPHRLAEQEKVKKLLKKGSCDCVIFRPNGEQAEITDYTTVLDKLIRPGALIKHHLLETNSNIHNRGFEVLYSSDTLDLVRHRCQAGVGVWLYWKCTWEPNRSKSEIQWSNLTHAAAGYIKHGFAFGEGAPESTTSLRSIFGNKRYAVWTKESNDNKRSTWFRSVPFTGNLGKRKKAEIVKWVKKLEDNLTSYQEQAAAAVKTWTDWGAQLKAAIGGSKVSIGHYDGHEQTASINIHGNLNQAQIEAIAKALKETS